MIRFHCALQAEAAPLNAYFKLELLESCDEYRLFGKEGVQLLLTGSGEYSITRAFTAFDEGAWGCATWLNVGIAGSAEFEYGESRDIFAVSLLGKDELELDFYAKESKVCTLLQPSREYPPTGFLDMELWHVRRALRGKKLYSVKIVSDTPERDFPRRKKEIKDLMRGSLDMIEKTVLKIMS